MKLTTVSLLLILTIPTLSFAAPIDEAKSRCDKPLPSEPRLFNSDFSWGMTLEDMNKKYTEIYNSGKRLGHRAYFDKEADSFILTYKTFGKGIVPIQLPVGFVKSVIDHIETALSQDIVQYVFFPDMGHSHFFIEKSFHENIFRPIPVGDKKLQYETLMSSNNIKVLYHTAEQLHMKDRDTDKLVDDDFIRFRYYTRNIVGETHQDHNHLEIVKDFSGKFNTVGKYKDYTYWGAGFNISASKDGCFSFKDKNGNIQYFDISLHDLESNPGLVEDEF